MDVIILNDILRLFLTVTTDKILERLVAYVTNSPYEIYSVKDF